MQHLQQQHQHQRQGSLSEVLSLRLGSQAGGDPHGTHRQGKQDAKLCLLLVLGIL